MLTVNSVWALAETASDEEVIAALMEAPWGLQDGGRVRITNVYVGDMKDDRAVLVDSVHVITVRYCSINSTAPTVIERRSRSEYKEAQEKRLQERRRRGRLAAEKDLLREALVAAIDRGAAVWWAPGQEGGTLSLSDGGERFSARGVSRSLAVQPPGELYPNQTDRCQVVLVGPGWEYAGCEEDDIPSSTPHRTGSLGRKAQLSL